MKRQIKVTDITSRLIEVGERSTISIHSCPSRTVIMVGEQQLYADGNELYRGSSTCIPAELQDEAVQQFKIDYENHMLKIWLYK